MKVTLVSSALSAALAIAGRSVGTDKTLPSSGCVLIEATPDGGLTLTGDDRRIRSWTTADAEVEQAGAICLRKDALDGFLGSIADLGDVVLTATPDRATLTCGPTTVRMAGVKADQFPVIQASADVQAELHLDDDAFGVLVGSTAFAADTKPDNNPTRGCVHIVTHGDQIIFEATDGLRLARCVLNFDDAPDVDVLVPAAALGIAAKLAGGKGAVRLAVTPAHLLVDVGDAHIAITRGEGQFPNVDRIIPQESASRLTVNRAILAKALKLVNNLERTAVGYRMDVAVADAAMSLRASDRSQDHEAHTEIPIDLDGAPVALALTATHLSQALEALDTFERIEIQIQSAAHPILVRGVGNEIHGQIHVLMPILTARPS